MNQLGVTPANILIWGVTPASRYFKLPSGIRIHPIYGVFGARVRLDYQILIIGYLGTKRIRILIILVRVIVHYI